MNQKKLKYQRILLKLGGEVFAKKDGWGISFTAFDKIAQQLIKIKMAKGVQLAIVVGAGNIFRSREVEGREIDEAVADAMGMLGTVINGLALQEALERQGVSTRMMTAFEMKAVAEPYIRRRTLRHLEKGRILIFTAGVGSPFFTTDSAAALRACEINCDLILKTTNVDGVYSADPQTDQQAKKYLKISYQQAIKKNIKVMDATAFALCWKKKKPIIVFNIRDIDKIPNILVGKKLGTLIS